MPGNGGAAAAMSVPQVEEPGGTAVSEELASHFEALWRGFAYGIVTPVLGAGASLYGRNDTDGPWNGPPSSSELAELLAKDFKMSQSSNNLLEVAQWVATLKGGSGPLYFALHELFDRDIPMTHLHELLAAIPNRIREASRLRYPPLFVTTNYDDLLEQALTAANEPFDLLAYVAEGNDRGLFRHVAPNGDVTLVEDPQHYDAVNPDVQAVVVKLHGFVNKEDPFDDSYVITEDHYIEYLGRAGRSGRADLRDRLPTHVMGRLTSCHFLFLGYSLRDWNLRSILYDLFDSNKGRFDWWSIQRECPEVERKSWSAHGVQIFDIPLEQYVQGLNESFDLFFSE